jgi:MinD superfamily P-loop ATPase
MDQGINYVIVVAKPTTIGIKNVHVTGKFARHAKNVAYIVPAW